MIYKSDLILFSKEFPQNCGDSLVVLEKTNLKKGNAYLFRCKFQKYPYEILTFKQKIIEGSVVNPQIEQVEFIEKLWPQNCGDTLKVLRKTKEKANTHFLFEVEFQKYPYKKLVTKKEVLLGTVVNPLIEQKEFVEKFWLQNCGDVLKIIKKINNKNDWECEFQKYPCKIIAKKDMILRGQVLNPQIEQKEFIEKIWPQTCGDVIKILRKIGSDKFECEFQKYPCRLIKDKKSIKIGEVANPNLPWKKKELFVNFLISYLQKNKVEKATLKELSESLGVSITTVGKAINDYNLRKYIKYFPPSQKEIDILQFCLSLGVQAKNAPSLLDGKEIDIYISNFKLGIEFNGNFWHSNDSKFGKKDNIYYHQDKSLLAQEKGIFLFHIFEYEWDEKENIIKSIIKSRLNLYDYKIGARKCSLKEISTKEYQDFCNQNHLQGQAGAKIKLGLFYKDKLVQIMSFGVPRFTNDFNWEIIRECSKLGYKVIGGKEKLWNYFVKNYNPQNCISYCDFGKFSGKSYLKLGFKKERLNKPGFVWTDRNCTKIFLRTPEKNQEYLTKGYLKIYDAGQLVFTWYFNKN